MPLTKLKPKPDVRRCKYGCTDPTTCAYPHADCGHCKSARKGLASNPVNTDRALKQNYTRTHPL